MQDFDREDFYVNRVLPYTLILSIVLRNESSYPLDIVWENAQDLEHVATLHSKTNYSFKFLNYIKSKNRDFAYEDMAFTTVRKILKLFPVTSFGIRKIVNKYEINQFEFSPLTRIYTVLESRLIPNYNDQNGTVLEDRVRIYAPKFYILLRPIIKRELINHAKQQCKEDETFRARRQELLNRNIVLPYRFLDRSLYEIFF